MKIPTMSVQCETRLEGLNEGIPVVFICNNPWYSTYQQIVHQDTCEKCPNRGEVEVPPETPQVAHTRLPDIDPLGTLIYARDNWEPPPCPAGYHPRSSDPNSDDAWILDPIDVVCKHLELRISNIGACGYHRIARYCDLVKSFIGAKTCGTCSKKESIDAR